MTQHSIPLNTHVVTRLSQLRWSRVRLALELGVSRAILHRMMTDDAKLSEVERLAEVLGVSSQWLLRPNEEETTDERED